MYEAGALGARRRRLALVTAMRTAGRAELTAGTTEVIGMLGLLVLASRC